MEAKKQAGRSPAAFFAEWPLSDPAMRPTRSVTGSAEARGAARMDRSEGSLLLAAAPFPNYDSKNGEFLWRSTAEN